ncbi:MAG: indolepyruvate oxidoreductase subunit beta [Clostridia bacterium]|nr:indolepyruvate oxidoreductase subunit beta [Clostridia bacterium]
MCKNEGKNLIICGVGGQGIVLFGKILGQFLINKGYELKISDVVGLGQRGGNVECHFRYSNKPIMSPLIKVGEADYIISFEQTETLRNAHYLKDDGLIITSTFEMSSPTVNVEIEKDMEGNKTEIIKELGRNTFIIDVAKYSDTDINISQMANVIMLGFYSSFMGYDDSEMIEVMRKTINPKFIDSNIKAYELGKQICNEQKVAVVK